MADHRTRVLKHGDCFAICDKFGDIDGIAKGGLFYKDTRFLSQLSLKLAGLHPQLLSSGVTEDNGRLSVDLTNPELNEIPRGTIHLLREKWLDQASCHERLRLQNHGLRSADFSFSLSFAGDFADIFEVRGMERSQRGELLNAEMAADGLVLAYRGLDDQLYRTHLRFSCVPTHLSGFEAHFQLSLAPQAEREFSWVITCELQDDQRPIPAKPPANKATEIITSNQDFNHWLNRSRADLGMLRTETEHGPYPYAGIPWYSTAFGRDGILTALECLWFDPALAKGVLSYLAATQAETENAAQDAQPGKILHETRGGEMAGLGEVPYGRYYGSIDATPLFIVLAGAYFERTGDLALIASIWPQIGRALRWIDDYGDPDGDGFVEYARLTPQGLANQGWKDSDSAIFHADGRLAEGPIALAEVQGYVYAARCAAARLAEVLGKDARELTAQAEALRRRFAEAFWCEELGSYGLALDGQKQVCRVGASNPGHCLYTGIASEEHARRIVATLSSEAYFSGWGIRTLASSEPRYNPMSYHNGSIWPHDNALIAAGFARYGYKQAAADVLTSLLEASRHFERARLPELFCGFPRRPGQGPVPYPVTCAPQAWAAGAVYLLLQACLGLELKGVQKQVLLNQPWLPAELDEVRILGLGIGDASLDLLLRRGQMGTDVEVLRLEGDLDLVRR